METEVGGFDIVVHLSYLRLFAVFIVLHILECSRWPMALAQTRMSSSATRSSLSMINTSDSVMLSEDHPIVNLFDI